MPSVIRDMTVNVQLHNSASATPAVHQGRHDPAPSASTAQPDYPNFIDPKRKLGQ